VVKQARAACRSWLVDARDVSALAPGCGQAVAQIQRFDLGPRLVFELPRAAHAHLLERENTRWEATTIFSAAHTCGYIESDNGEVPQLRMHQGDSDRVSG
jgi:hypothetical protein